MNLLIDSVSHLCVDDVRTLWVNEFLYNPNDSLVDGFTLLVSEDYVDLEFGWVGDDLVDEHAKADASGAVVSHEVDWGLDVDALQVDFELTLMANFLCKDMVIEVCSLNGDVDILGMYIERMLASHIENISMPINMNVLGNIGHIHGKMNQINSLLNGHIGGMKILNELVNNWSSIGRDRLVEEIGASGQVHFGDVGGMDCAEKN